MRRQCTIGAGLAGLLYGTIAVLSIYANVPWDLQLCIVGGVGLVGAAAGYLIGCLVRGRPTEGR